MEEQIEHYDEKKETVIFLVFGFVVYDKSEIIDLKNGFEGLEIYHLSYYGNLKSNDIRIVGIKFKELNSLFSMIHYSTSSTLQFADFNPTKTMIKKMKELYPNKDLRSRAFIQNNFTSQSVFGRVMAGFLTTGLTPNGYIQNIDEILDGDYPNDIKLVNISHEVTKTLCDAFIGVEIGENYEGFNPDVLYTPEEDPSYRLYRILKSKHEYKLNLDLHFKPNIMRSGQLIAFIPTRCSCCG